MDKETIILFFLLTAAFVWWFKLSFEENRSFIKELKRKEQDKLRRAERVKQLVNKR